MAKMPSRYMVPVVDPVTGETIEIWLEHVATRASEGQRVIVLEVTETRRAERREDRNG